LFDDDDADIYVQQLGFHLVTVVINLVQKWEREAFIQKRETIHKTVGKHKIENKIENTK
jgi:hypothetical protein